MAYSSLGLASCHQLCWCCSGTESLQQLPGLSLGPGPPPASSDARLPRGMGTQTARVRGVQLSTLTAIQTQVQALLHPSGLGHQRSLTPAAWLRHPGDVICGAVVATRA